MPEKKTPIFQPKPHQIFRKITQKCTHIHGIKPPWLYVLNKILIILHQTTRKSPASPPGRGKWDKRFRGSARDFPSAHPEGGIFIEGPGGHFFPPHFFSTLAHTFATMYTGKLSMKAPVRFKVAGFYMRRRGFN